MQCSLLLATSDVTLKWHQRALYFYLFIGLPLGLLPSLLLYTTIFTRFSSSILKCEYSLICISLFWCHLLQAHISDALTSFSVFLCHSFGPSLLPPKSFLLPSPLSISLPQKGLSNWSWVQRVRKSNLQSLIQIPGHIQQGNERGYRWNPLNSFMSPIYTLEVKTKQNVWQLGTSR